MASIEFGVALTSVKGVVEFARFAERLGYDYLTCGEHVMFHGPVSNSLHSSERKRSARPISDS